MEVPQTPGPYRESAVQAADARKGPFFVPPAPAAVRRTMQPPSAVLCVCAAAAAREGRAAGGRRGTAGGAGWSGTGATAARISDVAVNDRDVAILVRLAAAGNRPGIHTAKGPPHMLALGLCPSVVHHDLAIQPQTTSNKPSAAQAMLELPRMLHWRYAFR